MNDGGHKIDDELNLLYVAATRTKSILEIQSESLRRILGID